MGNQIMSLSPLRDKKNSSFSKKLIVRVIKEAPGVLE